MIPEETNRTTPWFKKKTNRQTIVKTQHRKPKTKQQEPTKTQGIVIFLRNHKNHKTHTNKEFKSMVV